MKPRSLRLCSLVVALWLLPLPVHAGDPPGMTPTAEESEDTWPTGEDLADPTPGAAGPGEPAATASPPVRRAGSAARIPPSPEHIKQLIRNLGSTSVTERDYARQVLDSLPPETLRKPLVQALYDRSPQIRRWAAESLADVRHNDVVRPLIAAAVQDKEETVRTAAVDSLVTLAGRDQIAWAFLGELNGWIPRYRIHAYHALGRIGNPYAVGVLIRRMRYHLVSGGGPRAHIFIGEQMAYVKDYDVEVATNAAVADPVVGVVNNGQVLDIKTVRVERIIEVEERVALVGALEALTGAGLGQDYVAWVRWWDEHKAALTGDFKARADAERRATEADHVYALARKHEQADRFEDALEQYRILTTRYAGSRHHATAEERMTALRESPTVREVLRASRAEAECKRLLSLAETYLANGLAAKALEAANRLLDEYPGTEWAARARDIVQQARALPAK